MGISWELYRLIGSRKVLSLDSKQKNYHHSNTFDPATQIQCDIS